jgi:Flp pilus assembly protein TadG
MGKVGSRRSGVEERSMRSVSRISAGRQRRRRRGASAVELAIILPLFVAIVLGCVDFGRFAYTYIAVSNAARAAAAWEMMNPPGSMTNPSTGWQNQVAQAASDEMSLQPGFQSGSLTTTVATPTSESGGTWRFTVTSSYPFQTLVNWNVSGYGIPHSVTLTRSVTMRGIRP